MPLLSCPTCDGTGRAPTDAPGTTDQSLGAMGRRIRAYRFCFDRLTHCRRPDCPRCQGTGLYPVLVTVF